MQEEEEKPKEEKSPPHLLSPPTIKPVEVIDKLGDLSKIDISAEVTKLLTSIKSNNQNAAAKAASASTDVKNPRDPRQAQSLGAEPPAATSTDPRKARTDRRESGSSIYEQGYMNAEHKLTIYEQGSLSRSKVDVDLRNLDSIGKDLDMRSAASYGDTDLRAGINKFYCTKFN